MTAPTMKVPFAVPECGEEEIAEVLEVIKSGWLTTGSKTFQFEKDFSKRIGTKHCLAVNSATAALHLGLEAIGVRSGHKVIVPVHTFTATAEVVRYFDADPIFVDIDRDTFCMSMEEIQKGLDIQRLRFENSGLKAIIPVHFGGQACDMKPIVEKAGVHGIKILEDAAHAFPAYYEWDDPPDKSDHSRSENNIRMVGTIGDITCFSFYANKTITTGEGGMLATDDDDIARRVKVMRLHGIDRDVWNRFSTIKSDWQYDVIAAGYKYNMPDILAAIGIHQIRKAEDFRKRRQKIAETYYSQLKNIPGLILPKIKCQPEHHAWHLYVVLVDSEHTTRGINRDQFIQNLKEKGIGTSVHYIPLHRMTYYRNRYQLKPETFPNSEWIFKRCASLPIFPAMTDIQIEYVIESIKKIMRS
jgi:dTDP-4-amino-4,6-dideoxygalactose transaminase